MRDTQPSRASSEEALLGFCSSEATASDAATSAGVCPLCKDSKPTQGRVEGDSDGAVRCCQSVPRHAGFPARLVDIRGAGSVTQERGDAREASARACEMKGSPPYLCRRCEERGETPAVNDTSSGQRVFLDECSSSACFSREAARAALHCGLCHSSHLVAYVCEPRSRLEKCEQAVRVPARSRLERGLLRLHKIVARAGGCKQAPSNKILDVSSPLTLLKCMRIILSTT